ADALEQAILNLITNGIRYSGDSREIELHLSRMGDQAAVIGVKDYGIGIPQAEHSRIFDKFYRVRSTTTEPVPGTVLGLTLALPIVNAHGGTIEVKSAVGSGSTFSVVLPLNRSEGLS